MRRPPGECDAVGESGESREPPVSAAVFSGARTSGAEEFCRPSTQSSGRLRNVGPRADFTAKAGSYPRMTRPGGYRYRSLFGRGFDAIRSARSRPMTGRSSGSSDATSTPIARASSRSASSGLRASTGPCR